MNRMNPPIDFYLASGSPRRREVLSGMGLDFTVRTADADETLPCGLSPAEAGRLLALRKAQALKSVLAAEGKFNENTAILAADTLVYALGVPLGKPKDETDALRMLRTLSGVEHTVCTGACLLLGEKTFTRADETKVRMRDFTEAEARAYVSTGEPLDKAGAYGIQGIGAVLVDSIDGDFFTVMGLSPTAVHRLFAEAGINTLTDVFSDAGCEKSLHNN